MSAREAYRQYREAVTACKGIFARGGNVTSLKRGRNQNRGFKRDT